MAIFDQKIAAGIIIAIAILVVFNMILGWRWDNVFGTILYILFLGLQIAILVWAISVFVAGGK